MLQLQEKHQTTAENKLIMKKTVLIFLLLSNFNFLYAQNILKIGNKNISLSEFENIFYKNNYNDTIDKKYLDEYIELFINFKLKVFEAESLYMDTVSTFVKELDGYQEQLAKPYLRNKEFDDYMIKEAYDRMLLDVKASHILVKIDEKSTDSENEALKKITAIRNEIINTSITFSDAATRYSEDPTAKDNNGNLGFFTAFMMVYDFESAVYDLEINEVSLPIKTKYGYHLIKLNDKRKALGDIQVAHIMFKKNKNTSDNLNVKDKINEIYSKLNDGDDFSELAERFSEDRSTAVKGGSLPPFGVGKMVPEFETIAFSLNSPGDYSKPFETDFGWHIISLINKNDIPPFEDVKKEIMNKISRDSRGELSKISLYDKLKNSYKVKNNVNNFKQLRKLAFKEIKLSAWDGISNIGGQVLFSIDTVEIYVSEFVTYILLNQKNETDFDILYQDFVNVKLLSHEKNMLSYNYPEYKALLNEYREGILLFDITNQNVWNKAVSDTIGLNQYFSNNKQNYMWSDRFEASIYTCSNKKIASRVKLQLFFSTSNDDILKSINKVSPLNLQIQSDIYEEQNNIYIEMSDKKLGLNSDILLDDGSIVLVYIKNIIPSRNKEISDVRGKVISDYQSYLEDQWIEKLRKKYTIKINKDVLYSLVKN
tara:strand:+ start:46544 stop:48502 length:1959 start_codon:yes stop_codon:yes gene_type:complete